MIYISQSQECVQNVEGKLWLKLLGNPISPKSLVGPGLIYPFGPFTDQLKLLYWYMISYANAKNMFGDYSLLLE